MTSATKRIAIVGGGISGLTLAYHLQKSSKTEFHLFERSKKLGGIIQTEKRDGFVLEKGPDGFLQQKPTVLNLAKELGIENELITTKTENRRSMILQNGSLVEVPDGFYLMSPSKLFPFLKSPLLSWKGKLRTVAEIFVPAKKDSSDESLASFVRRRFGQENLEKISQAMLGGIYTADPETLSMRAALPRFVDMEKKQGSITRAILKTMAGQENISGARYGLFGSFRNGMSTLVENLQNNIAPSSIHVESQVQQIQFDPKMKVWNVTVNDVTESFDTIYLAIPPHQIANIFSDLTETDQKTLKSIPYASSGIFHFGFKSSQIHKKPKAVGFIVPHREKKHFIACSFLSDKYAYRSPEGYELLRVFVGGALQEEVLNLPAANLKSKVLEEISKILDIEGAPVLEDFTFWQKSMPQYTLGHLERVQQIQTIFQKFQNIYCLGNAYHGVGIPDLIEQAKKPCFL